MAVRSDVEFFSGAVGAPALAWNGAHPWLAGARIWSTTNAGTDTWLALLHTLGLEAEPLLMSSMCASFEGDQWTQVGLPAADLWSCHGIAVESLHVWRPLLAHLVAQLDRGNAVLVDVDLFQLPDMIGSGYQREHAPTVIAVTGYDRHAHELHYIHGAHGGTIAGRDLDALLAAGIGAAHLPPTTRLVKLERLMARSRTELGEIGIALARLHGTRLPADNPVVAFGEALRAHGSWLSGGDASHYQRWAYATLHQCGAAFELAGDACRWLAGHGQPVQGAVEPLKAVSRGARSLHQRLVRVPQSGRMPDVSQTVNEMASAWTDAMAILRPAYGT